MEQSKYIQDLIISNATGNISEGEKRILFEWKSESISNLTEYNRLIRICKQTSFITEWDKIDIDKAKLLFKKSIKQKRIFSMWFRFAASIIIIFSIGSLYLYENLLTVKNTQISTITPGRFRAKLTLSNGENVELGEVDRKILSEIDGINISDKTSGKITYNKVAGAKESKLQFNTIKVPKGGEYKLVLSDGTQVWLNSETTLKYPVNFIGSIREVILNGEAYFEVAHNKEKPFYVTSEVTKVKVLGTSFNYKAYRGEENTEVTLAEGKVNVTVGNNSYYLVPGKQAKVNRSNREAELIDVDVERYISWKDGVFQFVDIEMKDLVKSLSRWYDVEFVFSKETLKYERFTGAVTKYRNIDYILKLIEETKDIKFEINQNKIMVIQL